MTIKWQYFLGGIFTGLILSGIFFLFVSRIAHPLNIEILRQDSKIGLTTTSPLTIPSNQGKININTATLEELIELPGVGDSKALAIINYREKYGLFDNIEEILYVPGFGEVLLSSIKEYIYVE